MAAKKRGGAKKRTVYRTVRTRVRYAKGVKVDWKGDLLSAAVGVGDNMLPNVNGYIKGGAVLGIGVLAKKKPLEHCGAFMLGKALTGQAGIVNVGGLL